MTEPISEEEIAALAEQRRQEQEAEYGQFVAAQDILYNGALAYVKGAPVPVSNVKRHGYLTHGLVITAEQAAKERDEAAKAEQDAAAAEEKAAESAFNEALKKKKPSKPASPDNPEK